MKAFKSVNLSTVTLSLISFAVLFSTANAQEYDDMYFSKSDRKTVKQENINNLSKKTNDNYKEISESTETYSAKNINPEYIARYKGSETNQVNEANQIASYSGQDYFVEGYSENYDSHPNKGNIDYDALAKRDQMSASNYNNSNSSWGFRPSMSMSMGFGSPFYGGYGYNPYMMGYGSGLTMNYGFGSGFGYPMSSMAFSVGMSWGAGYSPWGGYPGYYNPYGMRGYDPWNMYGYSPYYGNGYRHGGYYPSTVIINNTDINGRNVSYKPRTTRASINQRTINSTEQSTTSKNIRIPKTTDSNTISNGRISTRDYSKVQNEYYSTRNRQNSSSVQRITASEPNRRSASSTSRYSSTINNNKPSRINNYSSGSRNSSYSNYNNPSRSSSYNSYSTPSRSNANYSNSNSRTSSSYSSGSSSRSSYSSGSRSSSTSRSSR